MTPPDPQTTAAAQALRDAEALADAVPSPQVRAAILRAAAAHGRPAGQERPSAVRRQDPPAPPFWRRWLAWQAALPVGAAAAVGIFAVALSLRVNEEKPVMTAANTALQTTGAAPAPLAPPAVNESAAAAPRAPSAAAAPPAANDTAVAAARPAVADTAVAGGKFYPALPHAPAAPGAMPALAEVAPPTARVDAAATAAIASAKAERAQAGPVAVPGPIEPSAPAPPSVTNRLGSYPAAAGASQAAPASRSEPAPDANRSPSNAAESDARAAPAPASGKTLSRQQIRSADAVADADAVAEAAAPPTRSGSAKAMAVPSQVDWLARIVALRRAHDDEAADRELAKFVRAYPSAPIPPAARHP